MKVPVLSVEQHVQFRHDGYVVVSGVLDGARARETADAIAAFAGARLDAPETWYRLPPESWSVVPVHQAQILWDNRQDPRVVAPFAQLLGSDRLWVSMDRAGFKPPRSERHPDHRQETNIHWDADPWAPELPLQGLIYLTDVAVGDGGFECVPSIYRDVDAFLATQPRNKELHPDIVAHEIVGVPGLAGDLVIWNTRLPHRGGVNRGTTPRVAQYLTYFPEGNDDQRAERVANWRDRRAPPCWRDWPGQKDPEPYAAARLTSLGEALLGLRRYASSASAAFRVDDNTAH